MSNIVLTKEEEEEYEKELLRLNNITNQIWLEEAKHNFENMSHTGIGCLKFEQKLKTKMFNETFSSFTKQTVNENSNKKNKIIKPSTVISMKLF